MKEKEGGKMAEEKTLAEQKKPEDKPRNIWRGDLKMVKGENTAKLVEDFTAEMTLVAEGLCEDQGKLRREVDQMMTEEDRRIQRLESRIDLAESALDEEKGNHDRDLTEMRNRLAAPEKKAGREPVKEKRKNGNIIKDLTWLVGIAGASWIIVTILNKFF